MKTLVVGWGNRIAGDDAVGLTAAEAVAARLGHRKDVDVIVTSHGGFRLAERTLDFDSVVVLDAHIEEQGEPRESVSITRVKPQELEQPTATRHDGSLVDAFRAFKALESERLPTQIVLISVPIAPPTEWSEEMTPAALDAAERLAGAALRELEGIPVG